MCRDGGPCQSTNEVYTIREALMLSSVSSIQSLTGLEFATNLIELELGVNRISDVSPLKDLTKLDPPLSWCWIFTGTERY